MAKGKAAEPELTELEVGRTYLVQSVKFDFVGRLLRIDGPYSVTLAEASWVANSGRLSVFVREGRAPQMEIEPVGVVGVQWVHWTPWPHPLFAEAV